LLQAATAALAAAGYRASGESHHYRVLQSLTLTLGVSTETLRQLDAFRKKRNLTGYERAGTVSDQEAAEIIRVAQTIREQVEQWVKANRPGLM